MNKRGFLLTIATILLIIPLILLISYYTGVSETGSQDAMGKMRCDELHYFVEDVRKDMERSVTIFGRRSAIYALDHLVETGEPFENYSFTCTASCDVDCGEFSFKNTGSEAAIAELTLCGTLDGENVTYMMNHTIPEWTSMMEEYAEKMHFVLELNVSEIKVVPADAWNFALIVDYRIRVYDEEGMCYYTENIIQAISNSSIIGLEDPSYVLQTEGHILKYINNCSTKLKTDVVAGCSKSVSADPNDRGNGTGGGEIVFYSSFGNVPALINYCNAADAEELQREVLVFDQAVGLACQDNVWKACFNASASKHFSAVVDYGSATCGTCPGTIPYICDTGEMDNEVPLGGGFRAPGCDMDFITTGDCVFILNLVEGGCQTHQVLVGFKSNETNTTCYSVSDIIENYNSECPLMNHSNGPSFFDRMDGNLNLSEKYVNQSMEYFNTSLIGIETLVNLYELKGYNIMYPDIPVYSNATWVDYLYWQDIGGCAVTSSCEAFGERLKLDCAHSFKYEVDTDCSEVSECNCPDGVCDIGENCPLDVGACLDNVCYQPTCSNGCGEIPIVDATDPGECDDTGVGCAAAACYCDISSNCVDCLAADEACVFDEQCCSGNCLGSNKCS